MRLLLDTHALLWWWADDAQLSAAARSAIGDRANEVLVSAASAWEIATKQRLGRLSMVAADGAAFERMVSADGFEMLPVTAAHAWRAGALTHVHRDPFDRMLVALRRSGALHHTRAIVCGGFTEMKDNTRAFQFAADNPWGSDARSMVLALGDALGIPVYTGMPAGHIKKNLACPLGLPVLVSVEENRVALRWQ